MLKRNVEIFYPIFETERQAIENSIRWLDFSEINEAYTQRLRTQYDVSFKELNNLIYSTNDNIIQRWQQSQVLLTNNQMPEKDDYKTMDLMYRLATTIGCANGQITETQFQTMQSDDYKQQYMSERGYLVNYPDMACGIPIKKTDDITQFIYDVTPASLQDPQKLAFQLLNSENFGIEIPNLSENQIDILFRFRHQLDDGMYKELLSEKLQECFGPEIYTQQVNRVSELAQRIKEQENILAQHNIQQNIPQQREFFDDNYIDNDSISFDDGRDWE